MGFEVGVPVRWVRKLVWRVLLVGCWCVLELVLVGSTESLVQSTSWHLHCLPPETQTFARDGTGRRFELRIMRLRFGLDIRNKKAF